MSDPSTPSETATSPAALLREWLASPRELLRCLRWRAFDTSTEAGRGQERIRRIVLTVVAAAFARGVNMIVPFVAMPLTIHYLGNLRYGVWITLGSFLDLLAFADLGMGSGIVTAVSRETGKDARREAAANISSALMFLCVAAVVLLALMLIAIPLIPWARLLNIEPALAQAEAIPTVLVCAVIFAIDLPLELVRRVQDGCQEGFKTHLWNCLMPLAGLGAVGIAIATRADLPRFALLLLGSRLVVNVLNNVVFYGWQHPELRPRWSLVSLSRAVPLFRTGFLFFLVAVLATIAHESDSLIATQLFGPEAAAQLSVPSRLFGAATAIAMMIYFPLWGAYGEALGRGDVAWVRRSLHRTVVLCFVGTAAMGLGLVLLGNPFIHWWLGPDYTFSRWLLAGFALWIVSAAVTGPGFMAMNGAGTVLPQVYMYVGFAASAVALKVVGARWFGLAGVTWAQAISHGLFILIPVWWYVPRLLRRMESLAGRRNVQD